MITLEKINAQTITEPARPYLGMSELGNECERYLFYSFRWCFKNVLPSKTKRILRRGDSEEKIVIDQLQSVGVVVFGEQYEVTACGGHCKGHFDGKLYGLAEDPKSIYILEIKTMRNKYFIKLLKSANLKLERPVYYAQVQLYMFYSGVNKTYFIAANKDTDEWYAEIIHLDEKYAQMLEKKANQIINSTVIPERRQRYTREYYMCKSYPCRAYGICHNAEQVEQNCRTCKHSSPFDNGKWGCNLHKMIIAEDQQRLSCDSYVVLECLEI